MVTPMIPATQHEKRARWLSLWHRLDAVRFDPLPSEEDVAQICAALPPRDAGETLADWLARANRPAVAAIPRRGVALPFHKPRLRKLVEIRWQAAGHTLYPVPEQPIETVDPSFRLTVSEVEGGLRVYLEALGADIDRYAGQYVGIAADAEDLGSLVVALRLDDDGEGEAVADDNEAVRKVLCAKPVIVLIESDDA